MLTKGGGGGGGVSALLTSEKKCLNFGKHFYDLNSVVHTYPSSALDIRSWSRGFPFEMRSRRQGTCACIEIAKMGHSWNVTANYYSNMSTLQSSTCFNHHSRALAALLAYCLIFIIDLIIILSSLDSRARGCSSSMFL